MMEICGKKAMINHAKLLMRCTIMVQAHTATGLSLLGFQVGMDSYDSSYEERSCLHYTPWEPQEHAYGDSFNPPYLTPTSVHQGMTFPYDQISNFNEDYLGYEHDVRGGKGASNYGSSTTDIANYVECGDNSDVNNDYWVPEIDSMRNGEYEHDFDCVMSNDGCMTRGSDDSYIEHTVDCDDNADFADFGNSTVAQSTVLYGKCIAGQLDFDSKLELCVKEHELWVKEHDLWVQERAIIRKDLNSLRSRLDRLIEEEKCKKLEASFLCLERQKLGDDVVAFMDDQGLEGNEVKLVDKISSNERVEETDLVEISEENEGKTELSLGLISAMRCLELQRKFWAIGSLFSVIPAVPLHQFIDPFLKGLEPKQQLQQATFGPLEENDMEAVRAQEMLGMGCNNLPFSAWIELLRIKGADMILNSWFGVWRPPDEIRLAGHVALMSSQLILFFMVPFHQFSDPFLCGFKEASYSPSCNFKSTHLGIKVSPWSYGLGGRIVEEIYLESESGVECKSSFFACGRPPDWLLVKHGGYEFPLKDSCTSLGFPVLTSIMMFSKVRGPTVIMGAWFGIWRPPDLILQYWRFGSNMVGFWFDRGRPPESWLFLMSTA